jgi:exportin-2 (importin alpha re-exporter)
LKNIAERVISQEENKPGFSVSLLQIVADEKYGGIARLASALYFKNFIKRNWTVCLSGNRRPFLMADLVMQDEDGNYKLPQSEVVTIKSELIGLMISVPPNIQSQLGDAIGVIADSDFWTRWDTLVDVCTHKSKQYSCNSLC